MKINISREDIMKSKIADPGWYNVKVVDVTDNPSKAGDSMNYTIQFLVTGGAYDGMILYRLFNSKAMGFVVPFLSALGVTVSDKGGEIDLDAAKGKALKVHVNNRAYEGKTRNDVDDFAPITADIPTV
jgi:hypothetical protein